MESLKIKLLQLGIVEDNQYLNKYCQLIVNNKNTNHEKGKTNKHHIIPKNYYKTRNIPIDDSNDNLVNLLFKDHVLAHYYLALCASDLEFKYANELAFGYLTHNIKYPIAENEKEILLSLPYYQELYEEGCKLRGIKNTGKKRSDETKQKMSEWQKGKPKSEEAKKNMSEAQKGRHRSPEEILHWKESMDKKSDEEKRKIGEKISQKTKGRVASDEEKLHKSLSMKGKPKSEEHKQKLSNAAKNRVGEKGNRVKLKEIQVIEILKMLQSNILMKEIASQYNVSISCISDIKYKRSWQYLSDLYPELYEFYAKI